MSSNRLQNIAKLSVLYLGCIITILVVSKMGLSDNWSVSIAVAYLAIIVLLERMRVFSYFDKIAFAGSYVFVSLILAHYAFNLTKDNPYFIFGYAAILNFVASCGYLIYVLHTFKPRQSDEG